jgi:hypothetical protein
MVVVGDIKKCGAKVQKNIMKQKEKTLKHVAAAY